MTNRTYTVTLGPYGLEYPPGGILPDGSRFGDHCKNIDVRAKTASEASAIAREKHPELDVLDVGDAFYT